MLVDRDHDLPRERAAARVDGSPEQYLRLVANPFLGFLVLALGGWLSLRLSQSPTLSIAALCFLPVVVALWWLPRLCQVHCLDCGRNELLGDWKSHTCHAVELRHHDPVPPRWPFPSPVLQFWVWVQFLACGLLVGLVINFAR